MATVVFANGPRPRSGSSGASLLSRSPDLAGPAAAPLLHEWGRRGGRDGRGRARGRRRDGGGVQCSRLCPASLSDGQSWRLLGRRSSRSPPRDSGGGRGLSYAAAGGAARSSASPGREGGFHLRPYLFPLFSQRGGKKESLRKKEVGRSEVVKKKIQTSSASNKGRERCQRTAPLLLQGAPLPPGPIASPPRRFSGTLLPLLGAARAMRPARAPARAAAAGSTDRRRCRRRALGERRLPGASALRSG